MLDNRDLTLGLAVITGRARSAAKALSIVAQDMTRSRLPGEDPKTLSLRLEEDQLFQSTGNGSMALAIVSPSGCFPASIACTISGAISVMRRSRLT